MIHHVRRVLFVVAALSLILAATRVDRVAAQSSGCPCSIWPPAATPANPAVTDGQPIEVGVKFRILTTRNDSLIFGVGNDWNHAIPRTPGANQALVHQYLAAVSRSHTSHVHHS
jgi:hypothetical protein